MTKSIAILESLSPNAAQRLLQQLAANARERQKLQSGVTDTILSIESVESNPHIRSDLQIAELVRFTLECDRLLKADIAAFELALSPPNPASVSSSPKSPSEESQ